MYNSQEIADRIKERANHKKISINQLLLNCELGKNTVSKLSKGTDILAQNLTKIADYLDCSVDYLLGRTDDPASSHSSSPVYVIGESGDREVRQSASSKDRDDLLADLGIHKTGYLMSKDNIKTEVTDNEYNFLINQLELFRQK